MVLACTLIAWGERFELGATLAEANEQVMHLAHLALFDLLHPEQAGMQGGR